MPLGQLTAYFFAGAFLTNAIPHMVAGVMGEPFQSPFAKPPGKGESSARVNVVWGFFNLVIGYVLLMHVGDFNLRDWVHAGALLSGVLAMGLVAAVSFAPLHGGNAPKNAA